MPTQADIANWFVQNIGWTVVQRILVAIFMTAILTEGVNKAFGLLVARRQKIWFFITILMIAILVIINIGETAPRAALKAMIPYLAVSLGHPPFAVATVSIFNAGTAQTVVTDISLKTVVDGRTYLGVPTTMPETLKLSISGKDVVYHGSDSLANKISVPIVSGGEANGVCLFVFRDATPELLNRSNTYTMSYRDVFGTLYETSRDIVANASSPPTIDLPGIRQDVNPAAPPEIPQSVPAH